MLHSARVALFILYEKAHQSNWAATKGSLLGSQPPSWVGDSTPKIQADIEGLPSQWGTHAGGRRKRSFSTFLPTTQFCSEFCLSRKCTLWYFENVMRRSTQEKSHLPVPNVTSHLQVKSLCLLKMWQVDSSGFALLTRIQTEWHFETSLKDPLRRKSNLPVGNMTRHSTGLPL